MDDKDSDFTFIAIPKNILKLTDIRITDKVVYSVLLGFSANGDPWCSDAYLAEICGLTENTISNSIRRLEESGYITRRTKTIRGAQKERLISIVPRPRLKRSDDPKNDGRRPQEIGSYDPKNDGRTTPKFGDNNINDNINDKINSSFDLESEKVKIGSHFSAKRSEIEALIKQDTEKVFRARVETINDYCQANGRKYKNYAAAYRNFRRSDSKNSKYDKDQAIRQPRPEHTLVKKQQDPRKGNEQQIKQIIEAAKAKLCV